jgi:hypothetical protein
MNLEEQGFTVTNRIELVRPDNEGSSFFEKHLKGNDYLLCEKTIKGKYLFFFSTMYINSGRIDKILEV